VIKTCIMTTNDYINPQAAATAMNGHKVAVTPLHLKARSEEVQDIITKMPHWIIRRGMMLLLLIILMLFTGACFIHFPDVVTTNVNIASSNPPVKIIAQSSGKIKQILTENNHVVQPGETIIVLDNAASYKDVVSFQQLLIRLDTAANFEPVLKDVIINRYAQLGELQAGYADLAQQIAQYRFFTTRNFASEKMQQLQSQINYQAQLDKELQNKDHLLAEQLMLERKKFMADSTLVKEKVIAPLEFDNSRKELINRQINADATKTTLLQNKLQQTEYQKVITDLQQQSLQQENDLLQKIKETVKKIRGQMDEWELKYLVKSPVDGKVVFFRFWKENQFVNQGDAVLLVVPPVQTFIAKAELPLNGAGKVKVGQKVLIKLSAYPFEEFGMIRGAVKTVSGVALDSVYSMEIKLTEGLLTTANKKIPVQPVLPGVAEVLTNDRTIMERLFDRLWISSKSYH